MADIFSARKRSEVMRAIRSKDTKPELMVRKALHRLGSRFLLHDRRLPGTPDIVLPRFRTAVQVRGCFFHRHNCPLAHTPKSRTEYWLPKLKRNQERDRKNDRKLRAMGWSLVTIWECQCRKEQLLAKQLARITRKLKKRGQYLKD